MGERKGEKVRGRERGKGGKREGGKKKRGRESGRDKYNSLHNNTKRNNNNDKVTVVPGVYYTIMTMVHGWYNSCFNSHFNAWSVSS